MIKEDSKPVAVRFFTALDELKARKIIRGTQTFTRRYGLNRRNFGVLRNDLDAYIGRFDVAWLVYLVRDYKISPLWLLLGEGSMWMNGWTPDDVKTWSKMQNVCKEKQTPA